MTRPSTRRAARSAAFDVLVPAVLRRCNRLRVIVAFFAATLALAGALTGAVAVRIVGDALERPGIDGFYTVPADAAAGAPGTIVKSDPLQGAPLAARAWRIMYRTTDFDGTPVVATGVLVVPLTPAPAGGRTVVSWGHPTTGSARECAPSYGFDPFWLIEGLRAMLDRGYAVVATDYIGMGVEGPDRYLIGAAGGNAVLDAVRAARSIAETDASDRVVLWGHSQGGQAVLFAAQQAAAYAPELDVVAVAAAAPAADLSALMSAHLDDISGVTIGSYAFTAFADAYGDAVAGAQLDSILTPEAIAIQPQMNELCLLTNIPELHAIGAPVVGSFTIADPTTTEPWATLLRQNSAGGASITAPVFIAQGLSDQLVVPDDTAKFVQQERADGADVTYVPIPFADHGTVAYAALPSLVLWLDEVTAR